MPSKLKSVTGASLGISLLLFLVCAVLGSVILTAGTTTLGRIYSVSDMDQRYYSVTSAAELLSKELTGKSVTITRVSVTRLDSSGEPEEGEDEDGDGEGDGVEYMTELPDPTQEDKTVTLTDKDGTINYVGMSFLTERAVRLMFGRQRCNNEQAMAATFGENLYMTGRDDTEDSTVLEIRHESVEELTVRGTVTMRKDGTLRIELVDDSGSYTLVLTLTPVFEEQESAMESVSYETGKAVRTRRVTKTATVEWEVGSISKSFLSAVGTDGGEGDD